MSAAATRTMPVTGTTEVVVIIGTPIAQVKSPGLMNAHFAAHGLDRVMVPMDIASEGLADLVAMARRWRNLRGICVTVPHKQALAPLLDRLSDRAARLSTTNIVRRHPDGTLEGDMLDGVGFVAAAARRGRDFAGARAAVIGAGGVASAIANSLCESGVSRLAIEDVDAAKRDRLIAALRGAFGGIEIAPGIASLRGLDLLVNGTPVGMSGDPRLPLPDALMAELEPRCYVADVVSDPDVTPFLRAAEARGCAIQRGIEMTETQMEALMRFLGVME